MLFLCWNWLIHMGSVRLLHNRNGSCGTCCFELISLEHYWWHRVMLINTEAANLDSPSLSFQTQRTLMAGATHDPTHIQVGMVDDNVDI